ncbi:MAG: FtsX-like permease family protein [Thermoproteota archaeon]
MSLRNENFNGSKLKKFSPFLFILMSLLFIVSSTLQSSIFAVPPIPTPHNFYEVVNSINETAFENDVKVLSNASRFTGYPGFFEAANYIAAKFKEFGLVPYGNDSNYFEWINVTVPVSHSSWIITQGGLNITAYPLAPNLVNPSPYDSGNSFDTLVYVGNGELKNFDGLNVSGKFVLMDFASSWNFYNAMIFGAKGVVYIPETENLLIRSEADQKIMFIPVYFPRLYIPFDENGKTLLELCKNAGSNGIKVKVHSSMTWEDVKVPNIVGFLKGSDPTLSSQVIVISAYYDSFSVVPSLAYGATDSLGVAELLQLASFLSSNKPKRSVLFVALAGHYQGLWGAREFVERHFDELGSHIISFVSLDLASESNQIGIYAFGSTYSFSYSNILSQRYSWLVSKLFGPWLSEMKMVLGNTYGDNFVDGILGSHPLYLSSVRPYEPYLYGTFSPAAVFGFHVGALQRSYFSFDSDPFTLAMYGGGFTFHTTNDFRTYQRTPNDVFENINFTNVWPQVQFIHCSLWAFLNEPEIKLLASKSRFGNDWGYVTLNVTVTTYDMLTSYYDPINFSEHPELKDNLLVAVFSGGLTIIAKVNEHSNVILHGFKPYLGGSVLAFGVNSKGQITWATDFGVWTAPGGAGIPFSANPQIKIISIFESASIVVPLTFQPTDFRTLSAVIVNNAQSHSPAIRFSSFAADNFFIAFVQPNVPSELVLSIGTGLPSVILNNASEKYPQGYGYYLSQGEQIILSPINALKNLYTITESRYIALKNKFAIMPTTEYYWKISSETMNSLSSYLKENQYSSAYGYSLLSWAFTINWYNSVMSLMGQVITSMVTFFIISLLFSFLIERLLFSFEGIKRLIAIIIILFLSNIALYIFHPAYTLSTNWVLVLLTSTTLLIVSTLLVIALSEAYTSATLLREKSLGKHFLEISRMGLLTSSMSMAIENLKKRKFRTSLTTFSIAVIVFGTITLASVAMVPTLLSQRMNTRSSYDGIEIRIYPWNVMNGFTYEMLASYLENECYVAPRGWLYPPPLPPSTTATAAGLSYIAFSPNLKTQIYAILALSPQEPKVSNIDKLLIKGRWFSELDVFSVILPESVANSLSNELNQKVDVNSTIRLYGLNLKVVGIISDTVINFTNPDGEAITPWDPQSPTANPSHIAPKNLLIIPISLYKEIVYPLTFSNIAIRPINTSYYGVLYNNLPFALSYPIYFYRQNLNYSQAVLSRQWVSVEGMQFLLIPTIIASATILDIMLAAVHERRREISIFNAVGMAPDHITASFFTEALTYAIPSIFLGYIGGIVSTYLLIHLGLFPKELYPNFSSVSILFVLSLVLLVILISALYPSRLAGRLAIPSLAMKWTQIEKGPKGSAWSVSIPLILNTKNEVFGFMEFLEEYMASVKERESVFYAEEINISESKNEKTEVISFNSLCRFAPYDLGIKSDLIIEAKTLEDDPTKYQVSLALNRREGYVQAWRTSATIVVDELRKQLIVWRSLSPQERNNYFKRYLEKHGATIR